MPRTLYVRDVAAVLNPSLGVVRRCTLAALDGRCRVLAPDDTGSLGPGAIVDGIGLVAVPGLLDAHVHWGAAARERWTSAPPSPEEMGGEYAAFLPKERQQCLDCGVTAVVDLGDALDWILGMRAAAAGGLPGPRVYAVGPLFTAPGGHPAGTHYRGNEWLIAQACRQFSPDQEAAAARAVGELASRGVDAIKVVYESGGGTLPRLDEGVLAVVIAAAHRHGLLVHAHVGTCAEALAALERGADVIEHVPAPEGPDGWERVGAALASCQAAICPTLVAAAPHVSQSVLHQMAQWVHRLAIAGVRVHVGTDLGNPGVLPGTSVHDEMALLAQGGMSAGQALAAATAWPADTLSGTAVGQIADGAYADWLLVGRDPLRDIQTLRTPSLVIQGGRVVAGSEQGERAE